MGQRPLSRNSQSRMALATWDNAGVDRFPIWQTVAYFYSRVGAASNIEARRHLRIPRRAYMNNVI